VAKTQTIGANEKLTTFARFELTTRKQRLPRGRCGRRPVGCRLVGLRIRGQLSAGKGGSFWVSAEARTASRSSADFSGAYSPRVPDSGGSRPGEPSPSAPVPLALARIRGYLGSGSSRSFLRRMPQVELQIRTKPLYPESQPRSTPPRTGSLRCSPGYPSTACSAVHARYRSRKRGIAAWSTPHCWSSDSPFPRGFAVRILDRSGVDGRSARKVASHRQSSKWPCRSRKGMPLRAASREKLAERAPDRRSCSGLQRGSPAVIGGERLPSTSPQFPWRTV
jgi:hypothetical protein